MSLNIKTMMIKRRGFSLIELLLAISILALVSAIAVPRFSQSFGKKALVQTKRDILAKARWAQVQSITHRRVHALIFLHNPPGYYLARADSLDDLTQAAFKSLPGDIGKNVGLDRSVELHSSAPMIRFYVDGNMDAVDVELKSKKSAVHLSSGIMRGLMIEVGDE